MKSKGFVLGLLILLLVPFMTVQAKVFEAAESVSAKGNYNSSRFVAGNDVEDKSVVDGLAFVAGNDIEITGRHYYGFYAFHSAFPPYMLRDL